RLTLLMGQALRRQDDAPANRCALAIMQGLRFSGDGTTINPFGNLNVGGTILIDATGGVGTYRVAPDCTRTLSITDGPSFNIYVEPGAQKLWITQIAGGLGVRTATQAAVAKAPRERFFRVTNRQILPSTSVNGQ